MYRRLIAVAFPCFLVALPTQAQTASDAAQAALRNIAEKCGAAEEIATAGFRREAECQQLAVSARRLLSLAVESAERKDESADPLPLATIPQEQPGVLVRENDAQE